MTIARVTETGVTLPREVLGQVGITVGDDLQITATSEGIKLEKVQSSKRAAEAKEIMVQRRDMLRRLAE